MARAPLRRSRSDSSAGSSAFGTTNGARYSSWSPHPANSPAALSVDSFPSSLRSQTFGGAVEHSSEARSHAASSEGGGPSSYASASPTPRSISTRYSDGGRESHRTRRSSPRVGPGSAFGGGLRSGDGSGDEVERLGSSEDRPFGEKSWEYRVRCDPCSSAAHSLILSTQVAEALFLQSPSRTPTNSTVPPSRKVRSRAPSPPSPSPRNPLRQTSAAPASWTAAANDRDDDDSDSSDSNSSWHDAEEAVDGENPSQPTTLFTVRPANRAAVAFGSEKTSEKAGARLTRGYLSPSPHLTPTHVIDLADADPFLDIPLGDDASSFVTDDEQDVVIPFLIAPIKSSVPASYRQSPPNFLSASPRELRRSWKREQRLSIRTARVPSPILEARPSVEERGTRNSPRFPEGEDSHLVTSIPPSLLSSAPSRLPSLPTCFDPLRLIPLGAWLFGFGFLFPPLWWIGAFVPRRRTRSRGGGATRLEEVTVHKSPGAALMEWPDWRLGARRPYFEGARPAGRISRILEGDRELWRGEFGWQGSQKSELRSLAVFGTTPALLPKFKEQSLIACSPQAYGFGGRGIE